jgi:CRISPR-associated protein Cmr6
MMEEGTIKISNNGRRTIKITKGELDIPRLFLIDDTHKNKPCKFLREKGIIVKIEVEGVEIPQTTPRPREIPFELDNFISQTLLPKDTRRVLNGKLDQIDNFHLRLNKCAFHEGHNYKVNKKLPHIAKRTTSIPPSAYFGSTNFKQICDANGNRADALLQDVSKTRYCTASRLIIGLGTASVFETGLTLHHIYGFPYIPSTSLKGVVRSAIIRACFDQQEHLALADKLFCDLFGCPATLDVEKVKYESWYEKNNPKSMAGEGDRQGNIVFLDAFPKAAPIIKEDIINVHYSHYYTSKESPTDNGNPIPIPFLTVENTCFEFVIGSNYRQPLDTEQLSSPILKHEANPKERSLLAIAEHWLGKALTEYGIGAKTALGYGFFSANNN